MDKRVKYLQKALFATLDGTVAHKLVRDLSELDDSGLKREVDRVYMKYVQSGPIWHLREHITACLADRTEEGDSRKAKLFRKGLKDREFGVVYWSIKGFLAASGSGAYRILADIVLDRSNDLKLRAQALKCLALRSRQVWDRDLPFGPGHWKEEDLRLDEFKVWIENGFPEGPGHKLPSRDPALDSPKTELEKAVARLDRILARKRHEWQDPAWPWNWLAITEDESIINEIKERWPLPKVYVEFLTRFSPIGMCVYSEEFYQSFGFYGAESLIEGQGGYAFSPHDKTPFAEWPNHLVVIGNHAGDPVVLDLSKSDGNDAPIYIAEHGMGSWDWEEYATSFVNALLRLVDGCEKWEEDQRNTGSGLDC